MHTCSRGTARRVCAAQVFYCQLCNKQYTLAMEYEAHLSSYDHNHKQRFQARPPPSPPWTTS